MVWALLMGAALAALPACSDDKGRGSTGPAAETPADDDGGTAEGPASAPGVTPVSQGDLAELERLLGELDSEFKAFDTDLNTTVEEDLSE